jgi:hypothetical protein
MSIDTCRLSIAHEQSKGRFAQSAGGVNRGHQWLAHVSIPSERLMISPLASIKMAIATMPPSHDIVPIIEPDDVIAPAPGCRA